MKTFRLQKSYGSDQKVIYTLQKRILLFFWMQLSVVESYTQLPDLEAYVNNLNSKCKRTKLFQELNINLTKFFSYSFIYFAIVFTISIIIWAIATEFRYPFPPLLPLFCGIMSIFCGLVMAIILTTNGNTEEC